MSTKLMRSYLDLLNEQQGVSEGQASLNNRDPQEAALAAALQKIADYAGNRVAKGIGDRYDREVARVFGRIAQAVSAGQYDKAQRILFQQDTIVGDELAAIGVRLKPAATRILGIEWNN